MQEIQMARKTAAYKIHMDIMAAGEVSAEAFSTFCRLLKTMRDDKLYEALEYSSFEAYCENAVGIKQSQVYNYIKALEDFGEEKFQSIGKLGIRKLQLIGSAPEESREKLLSEAKAMTTRQVEAAVKDMKEQLKRAQDEAEFQKSQVKCTENRLNDEKDRLEIQLKQQEELSKQQSKLADEKSRDAHQMEQTVEELKKYIEKLKQQGGNKAEIAAYKQEVENYQQQIGSLNTQLAEKDKQLNEKPIETTATKIVEVVPDEVKDLIYKKVLLAIEAVKFLTDKEIVIFLEAIDPDEAGDITETIASARRRLNGIDYKM
jgi:DNA repair exonuclease SbcCD ATPase subunit